MKKIIFLFIVLISYSQIVSGAEIILKPNLNTQMKKQEMVNKEKRVLERKLSNSERLKNLKNSKTTQNTNTTQSKRITLRDKIKSGTVVTTSKSTSLQKTIIITPGQSNVKNVDMNRVRTEWLSWYNSTRTSMGLHTYSYDSRLDATARDWNQVFAAGKGLNHHRRSSSDSYYSFSRISSWFASRGVIGKVSGGATTTENVGYGYYRCHDTDCTDELITSIRSTYDFFMSEKGKSYDVHYRSIVQPNFTKIGLDIIVEPNDNRYYLTVHYITEFE